MGSLKWAEIAFFSHKIYFEMFVCSLVKHWDFEASLKAAKALKKTFLRGFRWKLFFNLKIFSNKKLFDFCKP